MFVQEFAPVRDSFDFPRVNHAVDEPEVWNAKVCDGKGKEQCQRPVLAQGCLVTQCAVGPHVTQHNFDQGSKDGGSGGDKEVMVHLHDHTVRDRQTHNG